MQLKKQRNLLLGKKKALQQRDCIAREKKQLEKEIKELRNPRSSAFRSNLKRGLAGGAKYTGKKVWSFLDEITRPAPIRKPKITPEMVARVA